jgi:hypothetical protein
MELQKLSNVLRIRSDKDLVVSISNVEDNSKLLNIYNNILYPLYIKIIKKTKTLRGLLFTNYNSLVKHYINIGKEKKDILLKLQFSHILLKDIRDLLLTV